MNVTTSPKASFLFLIPCFLLLFPVSFRPSEPGRRLLSTPHEPRPRLRAVGGEVQDPLVEHRRRLELALPLARRREREEEVAVVGEALEAVLREADGVEPTLLGERGLDQRLAR